MGHSAHCFIIFLPKQTNERLHMALRLFGSSSLPGFFCFCGCARSSLLCWLSSSFSDQGLPSSCSAWASHCGGFSHCGAQALGWAGFSSYGTWTQYLQLLGSRAQARWLWRAGLVAQRPFWIRD